MLTSLLTDGGVRLIVRESGPAGGPAAVLVHGWAQSGEAWTYAPQDPALRLHALDLRGHGESDTPDDGYRDSATWAGDLRTVLDHTGPAVLVGWSYGGLVIADYLRFHGTSRVRGLVLVDAITELGRDRPGGATGRLTREALPDALSEDPGVAVPAMHRFFTQLAPGLPGGLNQRLLGTALRVSPRVREELFRRDLDNADVLRAFDRPALVVHGTRDEVVDPSAGEYAAATIPGAELRRYEDVGHMPFLERPERFAAELAAFVTEVCR
ncbi:alpha/beta fold hydrolase [Saccharothrix australiensis]|uniref:Pimeloyl-ACP methyl ester carboxylesterase n=1 Tax=Saccharothrix australiensis TaxID=2072 RepID=A0A495W840_9PSEU|nr:alpha/beta hydrolase [Saccharothrix australiensis]RKT57931.1 pimeloyl-ACP methyl ester carboxylesterase [Saccharothrix australiensis]